MTKALQNFRSINFKKGVLIALLLNVGSTVFGQTAQDRIKVQQNVSLSKLDSLNTSFTARFQKDEERINEYILQHPKTKKTFVKDGAFYFLRRISKDGDPIYIKTRSNRESGTLIGADAIYAGGSVGANVDGTGMVAGIWDGGQVRATHELLSGKVSMQANQTMNTLEGNNHMNHVSGTIVGKDIAAQPSARGIAYGATSLNYDSQNDAAEMSTFAAGGYLISNHSYGYPNDTSIKVWNFGAYDVESVGFDVIVKNAPNYLPFIAGGNEQKSNGNDPAKAGYDLMTGTSASKNVMTVGAVNANMSMSDYSNWGPTDDGRFKPEIVARGTGINSAQSTSDNAYSGSSESSSGTSYAAPAAAAGGLLLQQYYNKVTGTYMRSSTLKGLMLHTAQDLGNAGPDYKFGWGLLRADHAAQLIKNAKVTKSGASIEEIATNPINNGTNEITRTVIAKGNEPLIVSLAWVDNEGAEQTKDNGVDPQFNTLVYNFDIAVSSTSPASTTYPWRPMGMANREALATKGNGWFPANDNNNYRQVIIENPVANATYTIAIRKSANSPVDARNISLIVSGTTEATLPIKIVRLTASAAGATNTIAWETATEDLNTTFTLQRSNNGSNFTDVKVVTGKGAAAKYTCIDNAPFETVTYYRLKINGADGDAYSSTILVRSVKGGRITINPNPATNVIKVSNSVASLNGTTASIIDLQGKVLKSIVLKSYVEVDVNDLKPGIYFLKAQSHNIRFVKK